jgi:hypothetical protein
MLRALQGRKIVVTLAAEPGKCSEWIMRYSSFVLTNLVLTLENSKERTIHVEASMSTLAQPFDVCGVTLDGTPLSEDDWSYDESTCVLDATYTTTSGTLTVTGC